MEEEAVQQFNEGDSDLLESVSFPKGGATPPELIEQELPTWDDALAQEETVPLKDEPYLPTWDEAVSEPYQSALKTTMNVAKHFTPSTAFDFSKENLQDLNDAQIEFLHTTKVGRIIRTIDERWNEGNQADILGVETTDSLRAAGILNDYSRGEASLSKAILEGLILPVTNAALNKLLAVTGVVGGIINRSAEEFVPKFIQTDLLGAEVSEGRFGEKVEFWTSLYFPGALGPTSIRMPHSTRMPRSIVEGKATAVFEADEVYNGLIEPAPQQMKAMTEAQAALTPKAKPEVQLQRLTANDVARNTHPELFREYDSLSAQRETLGRWIRDLSDTRRANAESVAPHTTEIAKLEAKIADANPRKKKIYQERKDALTLENDRFIVGEIAKDNPDISRVRSDYQRIDYRMRDLAPEVADAYRGAEEFIPKPKEIIPPPKEPEKPAMTVGNYVDDYISGQRRDSIEHERFAANNADLIDVEFQKRAQQGTPIKSPAEQRTFITNDFAQKWIAAGQNAEEAQAFGGYAALRYEQLSKRLSGTKTAEELYVERSADVREGRKISKEKKIADGMELAQSAKGKIRLATDKAKAVITRFRDADFSTMVHETGHEWLEDLIKDAGSKSASNNLKKDTEIVKTWLGVKEGSSLTVKQHEKFARSFERYFMEGVAPTEEMAGVFAQFKKWMMDIYKFINEKRYPINDDIRDVFHRFVTDVPERTVIAPEREPAKMMADIHEADAAHTPPRFAERERDRIREESDKIAKLHEPEVYDELTGKNTGQSGKGAEAQSVGGEQQPVAGKDVASKQSSQVSTSRNNAREEGDGIPEPVRSPSKTGNPNQKLGPPESDLIDKAGNIRLDNIHAPDDVKDVLRLSAEKNDNFIDARRGVITDIEVTNFADAMGIDAREMNLDKLRKMSVEDDVPLAVRIKVGRQMMIDSAMNLRSLGQKLEAGGDQALIEFLQAQDRHFMIQETVAGITAEWGRAGRAFREVGGNEMKEAGRITELLQAMTDSSPENIRKLGKIISDPDLTTQQVNKLLRDSQKPNFYDKVLEFWVNAILSGPMTVIKNIAGTTVVLVDGMVKTPIAASVGAARRALGTTEETVHFVEMKARAFGMIQGMREGAFIAMSALKKEDFMPSGSLERPRMRANTGTWGRVVRFPTAGLLSAQDAFFSAVGYRSELNAIAYRKAANEGLSGDSFNQRVADIIMNPTEEMIEQATAYGRKITFQTELGETGQRIQTTIRATPGLSFIFPFVKSPANLLKYSAEHSPFGMQYASKEVREKLAGLHGAAKRDEQIATMIYGTAVGMGTMVLALEGTITGGGPSDVKTRTMWRESGWQPYSVRVGDSYYSYQWMEPMATNIGIIADLVEMRQFVKEADSEDVNKILARSFGSLAKTIGSKASMRGASDFIQAAYDSDRYGESYINNFIASFIPNIAAQTTRAIDPELKETRDLLNTLKSRIPFLSEDVLPRIGVFGQPIVRQGSFGPNAYNPIYVSTLKSDPVYQQLVKIGKFPGMLKREIKHVKLDDTQYNEYATIAGKITKTRLDQLVALPNFDSLPHASKVKLVGIAIKKARSSAQKMMLMAHPQLLQKAIENKRREVRKSTSED